MSAHTKNAPKTTLVRLALGTTATVAFLAVAAAPAGAINQDPAGGAVSAASSTPPATADGVDVTSAALGALGGIALGGAGLAVTLGVQRRRDHTGPHPA